MNKKRIGEHFFSQLKHVHDMTNFIGNETGHKNIRIEIQGHYLIVDIRRMNATKPKASSWNQRNRCWSNSTERTRKSQIIWDPNKWSSTQGLGNRSPQSGKVSMVRVKFPIDFIVKTWFLQLNQKRKIVPWVGVIIIFFRNRSRLFGPSQNRKIFRKRFSLGSLLESSGRKFRKICSVYYEPKRLDPE